MGKLSQRNHTLLIFHILLTSLIYPDFQRILSALAHHFIIVLSPLSRITFTYTFYMLVYPSVKSAREQGLYRRYGGNVC